MDQWKLLCVLKSGELIPRDGLLSNFKYPNLVLGSHEHAGFYCPWLFHVFNQRGNVSSLS